MSQSDLLSEVSDVLKNSSATVRDKLKSVLVERELNKRVDTLDKSFVKLKEAKKALDKIKPADMFDNEGKKVQGYFTKQQAEEFQKAKGLVSKLEAALEQALSGESFDKLNGLVSGKEESKSDSSE